jgi:hypothetical protein
MISKDFIVDAKFVPPLGPFIGMAVCTGLLYLFMVVLSADNTMTASAARCTVAKSEPSGDRVVVRVDCDVDGRTSRYDISAPTDVIAVLSSSSRNANCDVYELGRARNCRPIE